MAALAAFLTLSEAHIPFFSSGSDNTLQLEADISQVYYFKSSGKVSGKEHMPKDDLVELVGPNSNLSGCASIIECDTNKTVIDLSTDTEASEEPFTQSLYYKYFSENKNCSDSFSIETTCDRPWGAVVGKKEVQYVSTILSFPIIIARIHGSWWNDLYIVGWVLLLLLLVPVITRARFDGQLTQGLLLAAALTYLAFFVDKFVNTTVYAPSSFLAWAITFIELLPLLLVWRLFRAPQKWLAVFGMLVSFLLFFMVGIGFYLGNVFLFLGSALILFSP